MKKKYIVMSLDMFNDATSSTPIPVFTTANDGTKNETKNPLQDVTDDLTSVGKPTLVNLQTELIKVDFDKQTVSARALYDFLDLAERFSKWFQRMISYGLVENVDFTVVSFWVDYNSKQIKDFTYVTDDWEGVPFGTPYVTDDWEGVPFGTPYVTDDWEGVPFGTPSQSDDFTGVKNGAKQDIGDYLLTVDAAKQIAMVQRNEKGKQARNYFINIEKLYLKNFYSTNQNTVTPCENEMIPQNDYNLLAEKNALLEKQNILLEKQLAELDDFYSSKDEYLERTISQKIEIALKTSFQLVDKLSGRDKFVNTLPRATNQKSVVVLNNLEKNLHQTITEEDLVQKYYRPAWRKTANALFLTATEITLSLEKFNQRITVNKVGMALKKFGFERVPHSQKGGKVKGYFVIPLLDSI